MERGQQYVSYLLRLWQVTRDGMPVWRAMVEDPLTGERHGFASPELLFGFLREQIARRTERPISEGGDGSARAHDRRATHDPNDGP